MNRCTTWATSSPEMVFNQIQPRWTQCSHTHHPGMQVQDGKKRVIAYWSRQLSRTESNFSTIERDALAVVEVIKRSLSLPLWFLVHTVYRPQPHGLVENSEGFGGRVSCWLLLLQKFDFTVVYKPGTSDGNMLLACHGAQHQWTPWENHHLQIDI